MITTTTLKHVLYFTAKDGKSYKTITCKAQGRNQEESMTYELPGQAFKRFIASKGANGYYYSKITTIN